MEFQMNNTSWQLTATSEFLLNKLILKFCQLLSRFISKVIFVFFKIGQYLSVMY